MRLQKELMVVEPCDLKVPAHKYQHLLELGVKKLSLLERRALLLRFWGTHTITEVADELKITWEEADQLIDTAVAKIRKVMRKKLNMTEGGSAA